jgi:hypothetical protein
MSTPYMASAPIRTGLFSNIFKGFNFSSILNGTGKVLNVANQAIPLIKQAKPVINNAKTMFKVMNEFRNSDNTIKRNITNNTNNLNSTSNLNNTSNTNIIKNTSMPTFFQ